MKQQAIEGIKRIALLRADTTPRRVSTTTLIDGKRAECYALVSRYGKRITMSDIVVMVNGERHAFGDA